MNCKCNAAKGRGRKANILCECSVECEKGQRVCNGCQSDDHKFTTIEFDEDSDTFLGLE